jgi:hypothetical protein
MSSRRGLWVAAIVRSLSKRADAPAMIESSVSPARASSGMVRFRNVRPHARRVRPPIRGTLVDPGGERVLEERGANTVPTRALAPRN